jgi:hypothetical protein
MKSHHHLSTPITTTGATTTSNIKTKIKNNPLPPQEAWKLIHTKKETIKPHNHWQHEKKTDPAKKENKEPHNH